MALAGRVYDHAWRLAGRPRVSGYALRWMEEPRPKPRWTRRACANCGAPGALGGVLLDVEARRPERLTRRFQLARCGRCGAFTFDVTRPPRYGKRRTNKQGAIVLYVQQGAGVWPICRTLAQLPLPPGSRFLDVGCGYGFSLDYAMHARGWSGRGVDPARLAQAGRDQLGLPIELAYLKESDKARGQMDVVLGSEVLEHLPSPPRFVRLLRAMLRPGGVLVLTTPNGDHILPETSPGALVSLLSPGLHLVIQTPPSLRGLLKEAGFAHVQVEAVGHGLIAYASDAPLAFREDRAAMQAEFRAYLAQRAECCSAGSDAQIGFAGRAFQEAVAVGAFGEAERPWTLLQPAVQGRFDFDLDTLEALPPGVAATSLHALARMMPLNLCGLLYADAMRRIAAGEARPTLERRLLLAQEAAELLRRAVAQLAMEDGQAEDIGWTAGAEALLCAVAAGDPEVLGRLAALAPAPAAGEARRARVARRVLVELVNAGRYGLAASVARQEGMWDADIAVADPLGAEDRDALFCLAVLDVCGEAPGQAGRARPRFARVREAALPGDGLWWAALRGELQALDQLGDGLEALRVTEAALAEVPRETTPADIAARLAPQPVPDCG
jgi:2-polyprenyl-3-methyl-5-hydroxy-6-metoxy-1,4-benzoquinol methylase